MVIDFIKYKKEKEEMNKVKKIKKNIDKIGELFIILNKLDNKKEK